MRPSLSQGLCAVLLLGLCGVPAAAEADPGAASWQQITAPRLGSVPEGRLAAVSCPQVRCTAVGSSIDGSGRAVPLVEVQDRSGWAPQAAPAPSDSIDATFASVACPTTTDCLAVGSRLDTLRRRHPLIGVRVGGRWSLKASVDLPDAALTGVSCTQPTWCVAVGWQAVSGALSTLAVTWDGTTTRATPTAPLPAGQPSAFTAIACPATGVCTAVGSVGPPQRAGSQPLAERLTAGTWSLQPVPPSAGAKTGDDLLAVSCPAITACLAVGRGGDGRAPGPLAERWDGRSWSPSALPVRSGVAPLQALACPGPDACLAAGSDALTTTVLAFTGGIWTAEDDHAGRPREINGAACTGAEQCTLVGSAAGPDSAAQPLVQAEHAGRWEPAKVRAPAGALYSGLGDVSCPRPTWCLTVGGRIRPDGLTIQTVVLRRTGHSWRTVDPPTFAGAAISLVSVSCPRAVWCTAIGSRPAAAGSAPVAAVYDPTGWHTVDIDAAAAGQASLTSVSCAAVGWCLAVGSRSDGTGRIQAWAVALRDRVATPLATPGVAGDAHLEGVSCPEPAICMAVGSRHDPGALNDRTLTELFRDGRVGVVSSPDAAADGGGSRLHAVACADRGDCLAVGDSLPQVEPHPGLAFSEHYDVTGWQLVDTPSSGQVESPLAAVACPRRTSCTAVGDALVDATGAFRAQVLQWDGARWQEQSVAGPRGAAGVYLGGVSCPDGCLATGGVTYAVSQPLALAADLR